MSVIHNPITPALVFADATPLGKLIMIVLLVATAAAVVVMVIKLAGGKRLNGGSAFLSGLRLGGPIIGGLGACNSFLMMTLGYVNVPGDLPLKALAPGFAEAFMEVGCGFLAGAIAVLCNWAVESRIDRQVLGV
jgi:biopolymer transport protein ExbB/TolQ